MKLTIKVRDVPRPGGSKVAGFNRKTGKGFVRAASPHTATWRNSVLHAAILTYKGSPIDKACRVRYVFAFSRPKSHYGSGKNSQVLKPSAPEYHTKKPDLTKLIRSTEDALTGIVWKDDCQTSQYHGEKRYCEPWEHEGCIISIETL
jgi:Holliday junction resolvase RusA-like endonuclease